MPQFTICHLFSFFNLLWIQLYLSSVNSAWPTAMDIRVIIFLCGINVTVVVVIRFRCWWILASCLSIWLSNSVLQLIDSLFLKLFSHLVFFSEPCIFRLTMFIDVDAYVWLIIEWSLRVTGVLITFAIARTSSSRIGGCGHVKHDIIEIFEVVICTSCVVAWFSSARVLGICSEFGILGMYINKLIILDRHIFLDKIIDCFT